MGLVIVIPVLRTKFLYEKLLPSLGRCFPVPYQLILVSNEIDPAELSKVVRGLQFVFPVTVVSYGSVYYPFGPRDVSLRRNIGGWQARPSDTIVYVDDDELFPKSFVADCEKAIRGKPAVWGNYRYVQGDGSNWKELSTAPADFGECRENGVNQKHYFESGYAGLIIVRGEVLRKMGGWDMAFCGRHGQEDQFFSLQLAHSFSQSRHIWVAEPPWVWHPKERIPYDPPHRSNVCAVEHDMRWVIMAGCRVQKCRNCPSYRFDTDDLKVERCLMPYDDGLVEKTTESFW